MSYNPNRQSGGNVRRHKKLDPHAGIKRSSIAAQAGPQGIHHSDLRYRKTTDRGWKILHFKGDDFEVIYEFICARNNTGTIVNNEQDRCVRVLSGTLYITIEGTQFSITSGQAFSIPKETEYELASMGSGDTEVLFSQGADYEEGIEQITEPGVYNTQSPAVLSNVHNEPPPRRVGRERTQKNAERLQEQRKQFNQQRQQILNGGSTNDGEPAKPVPKRQPLAGQVVQGSSPRPVGAGGYAE